MTNQPTPDALSLADLREDGAEWIDQSAVNALVDVVEAAYVAWINLPARHEGFADLASSLERFVHPPKTRAAE